MSEITLLCRTATPFGPDGSLDESALRKFLQRFIENRIGVVLGSSGTGEGYALRPEELRRLFEIGMEECRGKVPVYGNPPDQHTARITNELADISIATGVESLVVFPLAGWHGMRPSEAELRKYFDNVLGRVTHYPVALAVNSTSGHAPKAALIAELIERYPNIESLFLPASADTYFISLKQLVSRKIKYFAQVTGSLNMLALGATGLFATEANVLPKTHRRYVDLVEQGKYVEAALAYTDIKRLNHYMEPWGHTNARWIKMFMHVMKIPGGAGGLREPYALPAADELARFTKGLLALGIAEVNEQARAAGLTA